MHSPAGQVQDQLAQVGGEDLRRVEGFEAVLLAQAPQPVTVPRAEASGPPGALGGRGAGEALGGQAAQAAVGVELRASLPAAVHHGMNAFDGDAGFGNGGGQDDAPPSLGVRLHRGGLGGEAQVAIQGMDGDFPRHQSGAQHGLGIPDLRPAGEKGQDIARLLGQGPVDGGGHLPGDLAGKGLEQLPCPAVFHAHGVALPLAHDHRGVAQQPAYRAGVQGGGHDQELEIVAQPGHHIPTEGQGQISLQAAFVELVEDDQSHPGQLGIGLNSPGEYPFGHHLHPGGRGDLGLETDPVAHGLADLLAQLPGHEGGGQPGRQPARFEEQDGPPRQPGLGEQRQGRHCGFARAGRSAEDHGPAVGQFAPQPGQNFVDGEGGVQALIPD